MCLITKKQKAKIAKEDIKVYKVLKDNRTTIFHLGFKYEHGETYKTEFGFMANDKDWPFWSYNVCLKLEKQFPFWRSSDNLNYSKKMEVRKDMICISKGFHAFENEEDTLEVVDNRDDGTYKIIAFEFIIPKGSKYYTDGFGQIVSNQIKML